jgi:hypothetical protein
MHGGGVHDYRHGCPRQERHRKQDGEAEVTHGAAYRRHARAASSAAIHSLERWMAMASL